MSRVDKISGKIATSPNSDVVKIKTESNYGMLKTFVVALLIVAQFTFLLLMSFYLYTVFQWLIIVSLCITVIFCLIVLSSKRTGQVKAVWIFFMLICFTFGWAIFLLSNEKVMFGKNKKKYQKIFEKSKLECSDKYVEGLTQAVKNECSYLSTLGAFPIYQGRPEKYYSNGASLFDDIIEDLKKAKKFIFIEYFIIADGVLLSRMLDVLKQKAIEGVDIRIIYDDLGSHGTLKRRTKKKIKSMGIKLQDFNKLVPVFNLALNLRDHRKIVVIDGQIAYTGGANLADEYINEKRTHGYWKDCGIKIAGECVNTLSLAFLRQWEFLTKKQQDYANYLTQTERENTKSVCVPYVSGPDYNTSIARDVYENMIANATQKIYIMTPYFIPDETMLNLLKNKAQSGVDVRIVLPQVADKRFVYLISLDGAESLINSGVKVYVMKNSFVHSKIVMTENSCVVGTINIDQRSFYQQFESAVYTNDKETIKQVQNDFSETFNRSFLHKKKKQGLIKLILIHILRLVAPLM